jgi:ankyrin repeat protein
LIEHRKFQDLENLLGNPNEIVNVCYSLLQRDQGNQKEVPLHSIVRTGNLGAVENFLSFYKEHPTLDVNIKDELGWTVLHHAANQQENFCRVLECVLNFDGSLFLILFSLTKN